MTKNIRTGEPWTGEEEAVFAEIMRVGRMRRISAIQLYKRCRRNSEKAVKFAREHARTDAQETAYEQTRAKRLAALAKARSCRRKGCPISTSEIAVGLAKDAGSANMASSA